METINLFDHPALAGYSPRETFGEFCKRVHGGQSVRIGRTTVLTPDGLLVGENATLVAPFAVSDADLIALSSPQPSTSSPARSAPTPPRRGSGT